MKKVEIIQPNGEILVGSDQILQIGFHEEEKVLETCDEIVHYLMKDYFQNEEPKYICRREDPTVARYPYACEICQNTGNVLLLENEDTQAFFIPEVVSEEQVGYLERFMMHSEKTFLGFLLENKSFQTICDMDPKKSKLKVYRAFLDHYWKEEFKKTKRK